MLTNGILILLTMIFILVEMASFPVKLRAALGESSATFAYGTFARFAEDVRKYIGIKTLISLATGALVAVWLGLLGVEYSLLWGLLAFLLNYVPTIGSFIAAIPAVLFAFLQLGLGTSLLAVLGYLVINTLLANVIEPRVMGRSMGLSTLVVFLSLVFWGWVLGPIGMLLSVPLTVILKLALEGQERTRWMAVLLGPACPDEEVCPPEEMPPAEKMPPAG
jgi:predicted PurR-regulated permease PerM